MTMPSESSKSWIHWSTADQEISEVPYAQAFWQNQSQTLERLVEAYPPARRDLSLRLSRSGHPLCWQLDAKLALPVGEFSTSARDDTLLTTIERVAHTLTTQLRQHVSKSIRGATAGMRFREPAREDVAVRH